MAVRQLAWLLRQRTRTVWVLAFVFLIAQPAWGYSLAATELPARFPPLNTESILGPAASSYAALPTWFIAAENTQTRKGIVDAHPLAVPSEPLPGWFYNISQPRPVFQLSPSITKATSTPHPTLGEVYTYTVLFTIPAGLSMFDARLSDVLPDYRFPRIYVVDGSAIGPTNLSGPPIDAVVSYDPNGLTWDLGDIGGPGVYQATYRARVDNNVLRNQLGDVGINQAELSWSGGAISTSVNITVAAPNVQIKRTAFTSRGEWAESWTSDDTLADLRTGELITITVSVTNVIDELAVPGHNARIRDFLPAWINYVDTIAGPEPITDLVSIPLPGTQMEWEATNRGGDFDELDVLDVGETFSATYLARVVDGVAPGYNEVRYSEAEFYSLPQDGARFRIRPGITFRSPAIDLVKTIEGPAQLPPGSLEARMGDVFTYTLVYTLPWGTTIYPPAYFQDQLEDGLRFIDVLQQPTEMGPPTVDEGGEDATLVRWDLAAPTYFDQDVRRTFVIRAQVAPTRFLGTDAGQTIPQGEQLDNQASVLWNNEDERPARSDDSVAVWFVRPAIQPDKWKPYPIDEFEGSGIPVRFELRDIRNISATYGATAYNVVVSDVLPIGWTYGGSAPPAHPPVTINGRTVVTWGSVASLPESYYLPGQSPAYSAFVITATPPATVVAGAPYTNVVEVGYDSAEGFRYRDQDALRLILPPDVTKAVRPTSPYLVGDVITYSIIGVVPANAVFFTPRHVDTLPPGVHYNGWYSTTGGTLYAGPSVAPNIGGNEVITWWWRTLDNTANDNPFTFTFSFETMLTGEDANGDLAWENYEGQSGVLNRSVLEWSDVVSGTYTAERAANRRDYVIQPHLVGRAPLKEVVAGGPTVAGGDMLTYRLVVFNTGLAPAYEVVVSDTLPGGLVFRSYEARVYPAAAVSRPDYVPLAQAAPSSGQVGTIGWVFDEVAEGDGPSADPLTRLILTYTVEVMDSLGAGAALTNTALVSDYSSLPGDALDERHYAYLGGAQAQAGPVSVREPQITKVSSAGEVVLGERVTFTITVPSAALAATLYNATVSDTLPPDPPGPLQIMSVSAPGASAWDVTSDSVSVDYGTIDANAQETLVINARVPLTAIGGLVQNVAYVSWDDATSGGSRHSVPSNPAGVTIATPDVRVNKTAPGAASPGYPLRYTIAYGNNGLATAQQVQLVDTLPVGVSDVQVGFDRAVTQTGFAPGPLVWDLGPLASNEGGTIWLTATIWSTAELGMRLVNTATISTPTPGDNPANNQDTTLTIVSGAVLDVNKSATPDPVAAGGQLLYTLVVNNSGAQATEHLLITDRLPLNTAYIDASAGGVLQGDVVRWMPPDIAVGGHTAVTFAVQVAPGLISGTLLVNDDYVAMADNAPGLANVPVTVTVHSLPILSIEKIAPAAVGPDEDLVYTLRYHNSGNAVAHNVRIVEAYDPNVTFVSASPSPDTGNDVWQIDSLAPGSTGNIIVTVHVDPSAEHGTLIANSVTIDSDETEPLSAHVTTRVGTEVRLFMPVVLKNYQPPERLDVNLVIQGIQVDPAAPVAGQPTRIAITLRNLGSETVAEDFWVDLYIDPVTTPTVNVLWNNIASTGKAWHIYNDIPGGGTLVIHTDQPDDPQDPDSVYSNWPGWFVSAGDRVLYAQVDSYGLDWGAILETEETDNVAGPRVVTVGPGVGLVIPSSPVQLDERR
jgi:uncharacterized repeat protein (TIGR01451 family)